MHPSSVSIKRLDEILTPEKITIEAAQAMSNIILPSNSPYAEPPKREQSFSKFPGEPPKNVDALVKSGFYYSGISTLLQCYNCGGVVNDFHQHPSSKINTKHREQFQDCCVARLLSHEDKTRSTSKFYLYNIER
jgi:hypothetical protein